MIVSNLHDDLFAAIEQRFATDGDLTQLCGRLHVDFVPDKDEEGKEPAYPLVKVEQGEEGGDTETEAGGRPVCENFVIRFDVAAATKSEAARIAWQIARNFGGDSANDHWTGDYPGVRIIGCTRTAPPFAAQIAQGECEASVGFVVAAIPNNTTQE